MSNGFFKIPYPKNEPVLNYAPGSAERKALQDAIAELKSQTADLPMIINGQEVRTDNHVAMHPPHQLSHHLGVFHKGDVSHVNQAIDAASWAWKP